MNARGLTPFNVVAKNPERMVYYQKRFPVIPAEGKDLLTNFQLICKSVMKASVFLNFALVVLLICTDAARAEFEFGVKLAASNDHALVLCKSGKIIGWGKDTWGQCKEPAKSDGARGVFAGRGISGILREDGTILIWGNNNYGGCDIPPSLGRVRSLFLDAGDVVFALQEDGQLVAWGNKENKLCSIPGGLGAVKQFFCLGYFAVALKEDGTVAAWGSNDFGECNLPRSLTGVSEVAAGMHHTLALKNDGTLVSWGSNTVGQIAVPVGVANVRSVFANGYYSGVLLEGGELKAWGHGQKDLLEGKKIGGVRTIFPNSHHLVAILSSGKLSQPWDSWMEYLPGLPSAKGVVSIAVTDWATICLQTNGQIAMAGYLEGGTIEVPEVIRSR